MYDRACRAKNYLSTRTKLRPRYAIALGTGLQAASQDIDIDVEIDYVDIPGFKASTVQSHAGKLIIGTWAGRVVVILSGRLHYYEGYSMIDVTFATRVLSLWGVEHFLFTNVAGGLHPEYRRGDLVMVHDHIYTIPDNPLRGMNDLRFGPRFPDMSDVYHQPWIEQGLKWCQNNKVRAHQGVYYCLQGPNLETRAEYHMIHTLGGHLVGMSTIPEVIVARHMGRRVNVISIVSNVCYPPGQVTETTIDDVINVAACATPNLLGVISALLANTE
ncbi:UNVERIFIED_CONTAM: hypothetical protein GTU68_067350 [Idotea baltica]|nr:hypothetical protein [Idotea baltica]